MELLSNKTKEYFERNYIPEPNTGCWLWTAYVNYSGYGVYHVRDSAKCVKKIKAHRVAYQLYYGEYDEKLCVLHKCDTPSCIRPDHLFLGTQADNMVDKMKKGRSKKPIGSANPLSKTTEDDVIKMRKIYKKGGTSCSELGKLFRLSTSTVHSIISRRRWKHVTSE